MAAEDAWEPGRREAVYSPETGADSKNSKRIRGSFPTTVAKLPPKPGCNHGKKGMKKKRVLRGSSN